MEADQYLVPEQGKYDLDGPKNLYDNKMLKLCKSTPLLLILRTASELEIMLAGNSSAQL
jgi:beta-galactosidase GanA